MKSLTISVILALCIPWLAYSQQREVRMPQESGLGTRHHDLTASGKGFFIAVEAAGGYSLNLHNANLGAAEINVAGGYRFNTYFRAGIGFGGRAYFHDASLRRHTSAFALPLYVDFRGNFIPDDYRNVVPYWSMDIGGTFPDGVMLRPTIGLRIGQPRSAFLVGISYMGQSLKLPVDADGKKSSKFTSMLMLRLGYEF